MTVSGRQKCDANVCRLLGAIARLPALGPRPDLTPVASDVTANEQRDKRTDRDSGNKKERERVSVGAQRSRDNRTLLVGFLLIGVYYLDNYTLSLAIK